MFTLILPDVIVVLTAFLVLGVDLFVSEKNRTVLAPLTLLGLGAATAAVLFQMPEAGTLFGGRFAVDSVTWWFKFLFILSTGITVALSLDLLDGRKVVETADSQPLKFRGEYYTILLFTLSGMMFLVSARDLITLYVSLELATIPLFVLASWKRDGNAGEAGLKYVIMGALASALLLYGFSLLYGLTGQTDLQAISQTLTASPILWFAVTLIVSGIGFKMTLVPFHFWAAEVYQGAPTPITAYLSVASKGAGLALMFQLFFRVFGPFVKDWQTAIAVFAALTMSLGNLVAIVQNNIKRFMAFSAISQAGYMIMGFLGPQKESVASMIFYMLVYVITNLAVFGVIIFHSNQTGKEEINDYRGLSQTNPLMALAMMVGLFGLAGIPPLSGFVGKFFLFSIASGAGFHWLVAVAAVNSTISLYYYLRIVRQMYIEPPLAGAKALEASPVIGFTVTATVLASVLLGVLPFFYNLVNTQTGGWMSLFVK
ncbi:NADH-quinone oxidoreductase subunit N [Bdellovibrionota bacterium FG-2]